MALTKNVSIIGIILLGFFGFFPQYIFAATLGISPTTGVYQTNATFSVTVQVNTAGKPINAADGTITFNPRELTVIGVSHSSSIFGLWTAEPSFSNAAGTISFSGGSPTGYTGAAGSVITITFRSLTSGTTRVALTGGSVLAADGRGTNVLTGMGGGTYTLSAVETQPTPEVIIEYVPPANTPAAPLVTSPTFTDFSGWYATTTAMLVWKVPSDVSAIRTLLDDKTSTIPTKVYDSPISTLSITDLDQGVSYFHIQFKNKDGWGKITNVRLGVDTTKPDSFTIELPKEADLSNPIQTLLLTTDTHEEAPVDHFKIRIDAAEPYEYRDQELTGKVTLSALDPGYHTIIIEAFDAAGNSSVNTFSFTILAFDKPSFTEYPQKLNAGVIPVIKGATRPRANVEVTVKSSDGSDPKVYSVSSNDTGEFIFIPNQAFTSGVYTLTASAIDQYGARSETSDPVRIVVQEAGYIALGSFLVNVLSVIVPLIALLFLTVFGLWYGLVRFRQLRRKVRIESREALEILSKEFATIHQVLASQQATLAESRKTKKLTAGELALITHVNDVLATAQDRVTKEISDVSKLVTKK